MLANERGIAFLEVLAAGVTLSIALIGLALMFSLGMSWVSAEGGERIALFLAQRRIEELRTMGLAGAMVLGPRIGKFNRDGSPNTMSLSLVDPSRLERSVDWSRRKSGRSAGSIRRR